MKCIALSDLHGYLPKDIPECDVVIIAGDILPLNIQKNKIKSTAWLCNEFKNWCNFLKCGRVIFIAGNHDFVLYHYWNEMYLDSNEISEMLFGKHNEKIVYLCQNSFVYDNKKFYGFPWCPNLSNWAFYKSDEDLEEAVKLIPDCDVLISHCPPRGTLQATVLQQGWNYMTDFGCQELSEILNFRNIKYCICGHIHSGKHTEDEVWGTKIVNVSIKDEDYKINYKYYEFEI